MEISKELLGEVLGFEVSEVNIYNDLEGYSKKLTNNNYFKNLKDFN